MIKIRSFIFAVCLTLFLQVASAASTLVIGTAMYDTPLAWKLDDQGHFSGFEVDLMNEICKRLQVTCRYRGELQSNGADDLANGNIDFLIAAVVEDNEPLPGFIFSIPYLKSYGQFMTLVKSPVNILTDLYNRKVGILASKLTNTAYNTIITKLYGEKINITTYDNLQDLLTALADQDVDAIFANEAFIKYWFATNPQYFELMGNPIKIGSGFRIMSISRNTEIMNRINAIIMNMFTDGSYQEIFLRYFGTFGTIEN